MSFRTLDGTYIVPANRQHTDPQHDNLLGCCAVHFLQKLTDVLHVLTASTTRPIMEAVKISKKSVSFCGLHSATSQRTGIYSPRLKNLKSHHVLTLVA
jgi:hypothetical protein